MVPLLNNWAHFFIYFKKVKFFHSKVKKKKKEGRTKFKATQSAEKSSFFPFLFFFKFPYLTWKPDNRCPHHTPFSCPSHLCVCTVAISKSISCHFSFLLAQFCSLHLPWGDKLLPPSLDWTVFISTLENIVSQVSLERTLSSTCWCLSSQLLLPQLFQQPTMVLSNSITWYCALLSGEITHVLYYYAGNCEISWLSP